MPELLTKAFGTIDVLPDQLILFPDGIFGFEEEKEFALLEENGESPFKWLQSTKNQSLAFIVIQPELFMKDRYRPQISETELNRIEVGEARESLIFVIVTIPEGNPELMTANLQGPVLINRKKKLARQCISLNENHMVRVPILDQMDG